MYLNLPPSFGMDRVVHLFRFLCCVFVFCVHNVASVPGFSILDCPFGFLKCLFRTIQNGKSPFGFSNVYLEQSKTENVPSGFSNVYLEQSKTENVPSGFSNVYLEQSKTENVPSGFSNVYLEQSKTEHRRCRDIIDILLRHICMTDYSCDLVQEPQCNVPGFKTRFTGLTVTLRGKMRSCK